MCNLLGGRLSTKYLLVFSLSFSMLYWWWKYFTTLCSNETFGLACRTNWTVLCLSIVSGILIKFQNTSYQGVKRWNLKQCKIVIILIPGTDQDHGCRLSNYQVIIPLCNCVYWFLYLETETDNEPIISPSHSSLPSSLEKYKWRDDGLIKCENSEHYYGWFSRAENKTLEISRPGNRWRKIQPL